jgi:Protein of unknown function (DUF2637)
MSRAERAIRWSSVAAVAVVAGIADWVSYVHAYDVIRSHGEAGLVGRVYPGTVDGLIYCASMVLLDAARRGVAAPVIARWVLAAGIGATLFTNVAAGLSWGTLGAVVAAWPALALVGSYELLMALVRGQAAQPAPAADIPVPGPPAGLNGHGHTAAEVFSADLARGELPGIRRIRKELKVGQPKAQQVREYLATVASGQGGK